jgi:hypothetical protein
MAKKDTITFGTVAEPAVNVHFSVGSKGDNGPADVMLIQTMFRYLAHIKGIPTQYLGLRLKDLPEITGYCDDKTKQAILKFQIKNAKHLLKIDGLIHPASYEDRNIKAGEPRLMSITLLHFYAKEMQAWHPEQTYIEDLANMVPQLQPWLS